MGVLLTNFDIGGKATYEKAIAIYEEQTGDRSLHIDEIAYWVDGTRDKSMNALSGKPTNDYRLFWDILEELNKGKEFAVGGKVYACK